MLGLPAALALAASLPPRLELAYELSQHECARKQFLPTAEGAAHGVGPLTPLHDAIICPENVGFRPSPGRDSASLLSARELSELFAHASSRTMTVELWLRFPALASSKEPSDDVEAARLPIVAFGSAAAAEGGLSGSGCDEGQYSFMLAQQGSGLHVEVARSLQGRNGIWACLAVEADEDAHGHRLFAPAALHEGFGRPQHLAVVISPGQPLALYVDGVRLPSLYLAGTPFDGSLPIDPQIQQWSSSDRLLFAPLMRHSSDGWAGEVLSLSIYSSVLEGEEIAAHFQAFVRDSAPIAPSRLVVTREDEAVELVLRGHDDFDARYSPRPQLPLVAWLTALPSAGKLWSTAGGHMSAEQLVRLTPLEAADLPLELRDDRLWYMPPADAFSIGNGSESVVATLQYKVNDGHHDSVPGTIGILAEPVNDAPLAKDFTVDAYAAVATWIDLQAVDIDSPLSHAILVSVPAHGSLHRSNGLAEGSSPRSLGPALQAGSSLPRDEWRLVYRSQPEVDRGSLARSTGGELLFYDEFRFTACDVEGLCSSRYDAAKVHLRVKNSLVAMPADDFVFEDQPTELAVHGVDMRGGDVSFVVDKLPLHGTLHQCVLSSSTDLPSGRGASPPPPPRDLECCLKPSCLGTPIQAGESIASSSGKLVYAPATDYFNCASPPHACPSLLQRRLAPQNLTDLRQPTDAAVDGPPDVFSFRTLGSSRTPSAAAMHLVWVRNTDDPPRLEGALSMEAVSGNVSLLPRLHLDDLDRDASEWELQLTAEHGLLSLDLEQPGLRLTHVLSKESGVPHFALELGDGKNDRLIRLRGQPSQLSLALHGASYKTFFTLNDSIAIQVADPPGSALVTLGFILVDVRPGHDGIGHDSGAVVTTSLVVFLLIALCGLELYKTLHNLCHPETTERQAHERFENWMDKLEEAGARVTKASDQYEKLDNEGRHTNVVLLCVARMCAALCSCCHIKADESDDEGRMSGRSSKAQRTNRSRSHHRDGFNLTPPRGPTLREWAIEQPTVGTRPVVPEKGQPPLGSLLKLVFGQRTRKRLHVNKADEATTASGSGDPVSSCIRLEATSTSRRAPSEPSLGSRRTSELSSPTLGAQDDTALGEELYRQPASEVNVILPPTVLTPDTAAEPPEPPWSEPSPPPLCTPYSSLSSSCASTRTLSFPADSRSIKAHPFKSPADPHLSV